MNGTDITNEDGKLVKTLHMHMSVFIIQNDGIMCGVDNPDIFPMIMEQGHVYRILIESFNFKTRRVDNTKYTLSGSGKLINNKHICFDVIINDYREYIETNESTGDYNILRLIAAGTNPDSYRTIRIMDVTDNYYSAKHTDKPEDKVAKASKFSVDHHRGISGDEKRQVMYALLQKSLPSDVWSSKPNEPTKDNECTEEASGDESKECEYTENDDNEKESTSTPVSTSNNETDDQAKLFITFLKDRRRDQFFSKMNELIGKADDVDDLREDIEAMQTEISVLLANVECVINRNKILQRDVDHLLEYPEYKELSDPVALLTEYITKIDDASKYLKVIMDLLNNKIKK